MQKRNPLSFGSNPRYLVDQPHSCFATTRQSPVEVGNREADVMDSGASSGDELSNRRLSAFRFEQLDERLARGECLDLCPIGIAHLGHLQSKYVAIEGNGLRN